MSTLLMNERSFVADNVPCNRRNRVLKSRENIFKPKCNKELKKKLKKYKLRRDGQEDPEIVDVSQILITSLRIKSPNNQHKINVQKLCESEVNRPNNYLTKMVRLKISENGLASNEVDVHCGSQKKDETISSAEAERKQTNAFKLLMDSRNKSIGTNSPGKEKCKEEIEAQENLQNLIEKKELKAKRILSLNRMAQAKGSLKKIQIEEYREENIKRKMEDRAKRLKGMIKKKKVNNGKKGNSKTSELEEEIGNPNVIEDKDNKSDNTVVNKNTILKTFDLFKDLKTTPTSTMKKISKEDEEFLQKLSPSIRKKENMLCYFEKIDKNSEPLQDSVDVSQDNNQLIIKVKLTPRSKVKKKRSKTDLCMDKDIVCVSDIKVKDVTQACVTTTKNHNHKRKRCKNIETSNEIITNDNINSSATNCNDIRPKRNTKRPVKYNDDFQLTSSDEEIHIFTPKKKRKEKLDSKSDVKLINDSKTEASKHEQISSKDVKLRQGKVKRVESKKTAEPHKATVKPILVAKKPSKLAPIFVTKPQLDSAALEAKHKFLHSGVPSQLKKNLSQQSSVLGTDEFPTVVHVQNLPNIDTNELNPYFNLIDQNYTEDIHLKGEKDLFKNLLDFTVFENHSMPKFQKNVDLVLKSIKTSYPKFPVYRTYHLLRSKSKGELKDCIYPDLDNSVEIFNNFVDINSFNPDKLNWADKYKPTSEKQVIGNFESIKELKKWLVNWTENNEKSKRNKDGSDSSDFYQSDADSRDTMKSVNNLLIITGKVGTGKTLSVYAVAAELAIKVIEVNSSAKRTGKIMLQDLQEATQSHKVDRSKSSTECSQKSQESNKGDKLKIMKKRGRKKKLDKDVSSSTLNTTKNSNEVVSQESTRTGISLILIDDADIVFDQDDGFCSAISQLIQTSKRPVILVTSSLTCPHLQKFIHLAKIIKMRPLLPRMLGTWLDIMCLADSNMSSPGLGAEILDLFKGDIRKTINFLQFYVTSQKYLCDIDSKEIKKTEDVKVNTDEENSCMSWADNEGWGDKNNGISNRDHVTWKNCIRKELQLIDSCSLNSFNIWWNLPDLLNYNLKCNDENSLKYVNKIDKHREIKELNVIADTLSTLSITDYWVKSNSDDGAKVNSSTWYTSESASVIDNENLTSYNRNNEYLDDIAYELITKRLSLAQRTLECENGAEINYLCMTAHRERDCVVSRHKTLTSYLNASASMDRKALALDYWPLCRNICRIEKTKTDNNSKRNNRFCHYLKSLNVLCKNGYFDSLGESLSSNK